MYRTAAKKTDQKYLQDGDAGEKYRAILKDHTREWPGLCCWWCMSVIKDDATPLPMVLDISRTHERGSRFHLHGFFCAPSCVKAFCINRNVSFYPSRMYMRKIGVLPARHGAIRTAANPLDQQRFGPGTFYCHAGRVRLRTIEIVTTEAITKDTPNIRKRFSTRRHALVPDTEEETPQPLRRVLRRHHGSGTLVTWLNSSQKNAVK